MRDMVEIDLPPVVAERVAPKLPFWHIKPRDSEKKRVLKMAYVLIANRRNWCQSQYAIDQDWQPCDASSPHAVRRCAHGAALHAEAMLGIKSGTTLPTGARRTTHLWYVNDRLGHWATLFYLKMLIRRA